VIATCGPCILRGQCDYRGSVAQDDLLRLYLRATGQFRVVLDNARYGFEDSSLRLFQVVGDDEDLVGCLLREGPPEGNRCVGCGLAGLLDTRLDDSVVGKPSTTVERKSQMENLLLMVKQTKGLTQLVLSHQIVNEGDGIFSVVINPHGFVLRGKVQPALLRPPGRTTSRRTTPSKTPLILSLTHF